MVGEVGERDLGESRAGDEGDQEESLEWGPGSHTTFGSDSGLEGSGEEEELPGPAVNLSDSSEVRQPSCLKHRG